MIYKSKRARIFISTILMLVMVLLLFTGCTSQKTDDVNENTPNNKEPVVFTYALSTEPDTLDPAIWFTTSPLNLNVYQTLLEVNPPGSEEDFSPVIAESYTVSDDGLTWTFKIRENMKFHDGTPVDAEAVRFSVQRTIDVGAAPAGIWSAVESMDVPSEYEIVFKLTAPVPFDYIIASGYGAFVVSPTAVKNNEVDNDLAQDWMADNAIGTGPYKLKEWVRGQRIVLERNPDYFGGWEEGKPDIVLVKFVSEYATSRLMLEKGEADMVDFVPVDQVEDLSKVEGVSIESYPSYETLYLQFNHEKAPTDDKLVRQALCYAFNYDGINKITNETAKQLTSILPSSIWGFKEDTFKYNFDLEKAKQLLSQSKYADKQIKVTAAYAVEDDLQRQLIEMYKSDLEKIGVSLDIKTGPWTAISSNQKDPDKSCNIFSRYWWPDYVDPNDFVYYLLHSNANYKYTYYKNSDMDKLIEDAHKIGGIDKNKAIEIYGQIQDTVAEDAHSICVFEKFCLVPMRTWVKNYVYNPGYPRIVQFYNLKIEK